MCKTASVLAKMQEITEREIKWYKTDFYDYDRPRIIEEHPVEFVWMVRDSGTHLMTPRDPEEDKSIWREHYDLLSSYNDLLFYCTMRADGSGTVTRSPKKCAEFAARQTR